MDISSFIPTAPLMAWFPVGTKGFEVQIRYLSPGELRRTARESVDIFAKDRPRFSEARHEMLVFNAAVQDWRGLTIDALADLVPGIDVSAAEGELPPGHQFPFSAETLRALTDHSPEFYRVVNGSCAEIADIRRRLREQEIKNSGTAQGTASNPAQ